WISRRRGRRRMVILRSYRAGRRLQRESAPVCFALTRYTATYRHVSRHLANDTAHQPRGPRELGPRINFCRRGQVPRLVPRDRPPASCRLRLNGRHAKADVVVTPLRFEALSEGRPAGPAVVAPAAPPTAAGNVARPVPQRRVFRGVQ